MIVDSSAFIAIMSSEPEDLAFSEAMGAADQVLASASTLLETSIVVRRPGWDDLDEIFRRFGTRFIAFDEDQARVAREAYARYGKGSKHPAKLNFGDCMSYALAKVRDEPLLFKGDDFTHTDVLAAI